MANTPSIAPKDARGEYVAGLRALADLIEQHPDVPLPYATGTSGAMEAFRVPFYVHDKATLQTLARVLPGNLHKQVSEGPFGFELLGQIRGLHFYVAAPRDQVCERVVVGTREVSRTVPDPSADPVPTIEITETVEDVEWVCRPLLADALADAAVSR